MFVELAGSASVIVLAAAVKKQGSKATQASNLFFQVISARHDQKLGTIATTNITFGKFNQIFANDAIAHAIVDRLVNEAEVFYMEGPSYREHQRQEKMKKRKVAN